MLKTIIFSIIIAWVFSCVQVFAAEIQGTSTYYITDINTKNLAIGFARESAKRDALEQSGVFVTSISESHNGLLQTDVIKSLALGFVKLKTGSEIISYTEPDTKGEIVLNYSAVFEIDANEVQENIKKYLEDTVEKDSLTQKIIVQQNLCEELSNKYRELQKKYKAGLMGEEKRKYELELQNIQRGLKAVNFATQALTYKRNSDFVNAGIFYDLAIATVPEEDLVKMDQIPWLKEFILNVACERADIYRELGNFKLSEVILKGVLNIDSRFILAYRDLSYLYMCRNLELDAVNVATKAIEIQPDNLSFFARAQIFFKFGKWKEALEDYRQVRNPFPIPYSGMGLCCLFLKQYEDAIGYFNKAIEVDANNYIGYQGLGRTYAEMKDFEKAIVYFTKVISLNNGAFHAYAERGVCRLQLGQYFEAYADSVLALKGNPNDELAKQVQTIAMPKLK